MPKFRVVFSGLCGFVPDDYFSNAQTVKVLMVNTKSDQCKDMVVPPALHVPAIAFNLRDLKGNEGVPASSRVIVNLEMEDVSLEITSASKPTDLDVICSQVSESPFHNDNSFYWVPSVDQALRCYADDIKCQVNPDCLASKPVLGLIAARFSIEKGSLAALELVKFNNQIVVPRFVPSPTGVSYYQALAEEVVQEVMLATGDVVTVVAKKFDGSGSSQWLFPMKGSDITIEITNLCCGGAIAYDDAATEFPEPDTDFETFYTLLEEYESLRLQYSRFPIPVPVQYDVRATQGGGDTIHCTMARFDSHY